MNRDSAERMLAGSEPASDPDLAILMPEKSVELSTGDTITVHEYTFLEGMEIDAWASPLLEELQTLFVGDGDDITVVSLHELTAVFGRHPQLVIKLMGIACDKPDEWFNGLSDADGQLIQLNWWEVNAHFFVRRLVPRMFDKSKRQAGAESSPASSGMDTASNHSAATPIGS